MHDQPCDGLVVYIFCQASNAHNRFQVVDCILCILYLQISCYFELDSMQTQNQIHENL